MIARSRGVLGLMVVLLSCLAAKGQAVQRYILQSNDYDPTILTSQPTGRWYHWLGADPAVTHLETGVAVDAGQHAGRGQRIDVVQRGPVAAVQVKVKRIGDPGPLVWEAGSRLGAADLGRGEVPADHVSPNYEHFVTLPIRASQPGRIYLRLSAASGRSPDDYYAVYCTWREAPAEMAAIRFYLGVEKLPMKYRAIRIDPHGAALEADGSEIREGASMMTRLLTSEPGAQRRQIIAREEEPYTFVESLVAGIDPRREGLPWSHLPPENDEIRIGPDWRIQVAAPRSVQAATAVKDLEEFFAQSMKRPIRAAWDVKAKPQPRTITLSQGAGQPGDPRQAAGYRFTARADSIQLHGFDARGVLRAVWHLENLLALRGGPQVKPDDRVREPRYSPRATCAVWAGTGELATPAPVYTNEHLSLISHYGYDAIWLVWYPGPEARRELPTRIAPGRTPEGTTYRPFTARLRDLTERAEKYDIEVVILYAAPHPADESQRQALVEDAKTFLREVPKVKTIVLLDEGMGSVRKGTAAWVDTCSLLARTFYEARPDVRVVAWRYTFRSRTPDREAWNAVLAQIARLDPRVAFMSNFDSTWPTRRDGTLQFAFDYCLSLRAPSLDFRHAADFLADAARGQGQSPREIWAKIETRFSQESNTQPEIPCMQRWVERYEEVNGFDSPPLAGILANWYHQGFFPTPVTELFGWMAYTNPPPADELLRAIARRDFGPGQEDLVLAAWQDFSDAIWNYPFYFGLSYPMNSGLAQPFWLDPAEPNPRPWRRGFVNDLKTIELTDTGEGTGSGRENRARLAHLGALWHAGVEKLDQALAAAPPQVRSRAEANWNNARSFGDKAEMTLRLVRWLDLRGRFLGAGTPAEKEAARGELIRIGREELEAARRALPVYLSDSRLGHLNHGRGCFTAETIVAKIEQLEKTLDDLANLPRGGE